MGKFIKLVFYFGLTISILMIGLGEENATMCCAAGLLAIAGEIAAKDGGADNG